MKITPSRFLLMIGALIIALMLAGPAQAQSDTSWCTQPIDAPEWGCLEVSISPSALAGDFYVDTYPMAFYSYVARAVVLPGRRHIVVNNITSSEPGYGTFFFYNAESSTFATVNQGAITRVSVKFTRTYINGALAVTCDIKSKTADDDLACAVSIDGIPQFDTIPAGATATYYMPPGGHSVTTTVVGGSSLFWTPQSRTVIAQVYMALTTKVNARFIKQGRLIAALSVPNTFADYYVDGALIASQTSGIDVWLEPNKYHKLEIKSMNDFSSGGLYSWQDYVLFVFINSAGTRSVNAIPAKVFHKGYLEVTCNITNFDPSQNMFCVPVLDGVEQVPIAHGAKATYTVDRGTHKVVVTVGPAELWASTPRTFNVNVYGGRTSALLLSVTAAAK